MRIDAQTKKKKPACRNNDAGKKTQSALNRPKSSKENTAQMRTKKSSSKSSQHQSLSRSQSAGSKSSSARRGQETPPPVDVRLSAKGSRALKADVQKLAHKKLDPDSVSKKLMAILKTLKKEYGKVEQCSSPAIKSIQNPVMLVNNKQVGPIKENEKPDGVVNLDDILLSNRQKLHEKIWHGTDSERLIKEKIAKIVEKHSVAEKIVPKKEAVKPSTSQPVPLPTVQIDKPHRAIAQPSKTQPPSPPDEVKTIRDKVNYAVRNKKVFTVYSNFNTVRNALTARGWVEKLPPNFSVNGDTNLVKRLQFLTVSELALGLSDKNMGHVYRQVMSSKMLGVAPVSLYWDLSRDVFKQNNEPYKTAYLNFISKIRLNYCNKQGLCESAKLAHWYNYPGVAFLRTPRGYAMSSEPDEFTADFKITAAMSLLKWTVATAENKTTKLISDAGKIPIQTFHFALVECSKFLQKLYHEDIDKVIPVTGDDEWNWFLENFYKAVHIGNHFKQTYVETELSMVHKSKTMLKKISALLPHVDVDGYMNIWLLKPSCGSRGLGIHFCRTLQYVLKTVADHKKSNYVIQKYIERPLLIHNTKFDIRQWFLISSTSPLTIWIWKECYLRFSSQTYNLRKLHESIHLTNNSVQSKYHNGNRDPDLPSYNMWYLHEFKQHLANIGYPKIFDTVTYPGIKECITAAILTNQDGIYKSSKMFELYGADFMITEDFRPWLIEINSKPALYASTPVTAKLCPQVLEDVIKVIIDYSASQKASTGKFELLYKEKLLPLPHTDANLHVQGKTIVNEYFLTPDQTEQVKQALNLEHKPSNETIQLVKTCDYIKYVGREMKDTLTHLLHIIEKEKERRHSHSSSSTEKEPVVGDLQVYDDVEKIRNSVNEINEIYRHENDENSSATLTEVPDELLDANSTKIKEVIDVLASQAHVGAKGVVQGV